MAHVQDAQDARPSAPQGGRRRDRDARLVRRDLHRSRAPARCRPPDFLTDPPPRPRAPQTKALALPTEAEMLAKDKYTTFSRTDPGYRKGLHKVPHWTRITSRENPRGF